jgi:phosphoglycolate phosphatase-like HAD superfamily hydrolase
MDKAVTWHPELDPLFAREPELLDAVKTALYMHPAKALGGDEFAVESFGLEARFRNGEDDLFLTDVFRRNHLDPILLAFDIDGTLLTSHGYARRAFEVALTKHFGTAGDLDGFSWSGKLDPNIMRELLAGGGVPPEEVERRLPEVLEDYEGILDRTLPAGKVVLKEGVRECLERCLEYEDILCVLCTGNIPGGARVKLSRVDLNRYFPTGAFGSDGAVRAELPPVARRRAQRWWGLGINPRKVFVIGDSPEDVKCAQANGYWSVAIASGFHPREELAPYGPDLLIDSLLKDEERFWAFLRGAHRPR